MDAKQFQTFLETVRTQDNPLLKELVDSMRKDSGKTLEFQKTLAKTVVDELGKQYQESKDNYRHLLEIYEKSAATTRTKAQVTRPSKFNSKDGREWRNWRSNFEICARINEWSNQRARREIAVAMEGDAKDVVSDIPILDGLIREATRDCDGFELLLDNYEKKFLPAAATDYAAVEFEKATQNEGEDIVGWHARCRNLYKRAYPEVDDQLVEVSRQMRHKFTIGLRDQVVKQFTWRANKNSYSEVLDEALRQAAGSICITDGQEANNSLGGIGASFLGAMTFVKKPEDAKISCHFCLKIGHRMKDCRSFLAAQKVTRDKSEARAKGGRGRGRGGFKRGSGSKRGGSRGGRSDSDTNASDTSRRIAKLAEAAQEALAAQDQNDKEQGN